MIGGQFAGVVGAILAVPILLTIQEIIASLPQSAKKA
jgi:predicted PurR-regulated permease PerM